MAQGQHPNDPYSDESFPQEPRAQQPSYGGFSIDPGERPHYSGEASEQRDPSRGPGGLSGVRAPVGGGGNGGYGRGGGGSRNPGGGTRGFGLRGLVVLVVMVACAGGLWFAYSKGKHSTGNNGPVPLIRADSDPIKRKPDDSSSTADSDADLYNPKQQQQPGVEHLLPPPEQPLPKPVAPPAPEASQPPAQSAPGAPVQAGPAPAQNSTPDSQDQIGALMRGEIGGAKSGTKPQAAADTDTGDDQSAAKPGPAHASSAKPTALQPPAHAKDARADAVKSEASGNGPFRVQIAATKDDASARSEFARLQRAHPDLLSGLSATVVKADLGGRGVYYRVQAGPIPDRVKADKLCSELRAQSIGCIVVH